ncbi:MAG: hypothetical protein JEZ14_08200 [Marinilabiliaceae bacterium]|nr:hypothetical protein [Marinilabiliaceae bacterium]
MTNTDPYRKRFIGVDSFAPEYFEIYFGREQDIEIVIKKLSLNNSLVLHSRSGMGKTSLINAGIIPKLKQFHVETINCKEINLSKTSLSEKQEDINYNELAKKYTNYIQRNIRSFNKSPKKNDHKIGIRHYIIFDQVESLFNSKTTTDLNNILWNLKYRSNSEFLQTLYKSISKKLNFKRFEVSFHYLFSVTSENLHKLDSFRYALPNILKNIYELDYIPKEGIKRIINKTISDESDIYVSPKFTLDQEYMEEILESLSNNEGNIELFHLQLLGEKLEQKAIDKGMEIGEQEVQTKGIELSSSDNIPTLEVLLKEFYADQIIKMDDDFEIEDNCFDTHKLSDGVFEYIEDNLLKDNGQATYLDINDVYKNNDLDFNAKFKRIIEELKSKRIVREDNLHGHPILSLYHDNLAKPIFEHKQERLSSRKDILDILGQKSEFTSYVRSLFTLRERPMINKRLQFFTDLEISKRFYKNLMGNSNSFCVKSFDTPKITSLCRSKPDNKIAFATNNNISIKDNLLLENIADLPFPRKGNYYIIDMCFSNDGTKLYILDNQGLIGYYNFKESEKTITPLLDLHLYSFSIDISRDDTFLAVGTVHKSPKFIDLKVAPHELMKINNGFEEEDEIFSVRFFDKDKLLVGTKNGSIYAYELNKDKNYWNYEYHKYGHLKLFSNEVKAIEFSHDFKKCIIGFASREVKYFNFESEYLTFVKSITLTTPSSKPTHYMSLSFSQDNNHVAIGDYFGYVHIWDLENPDINNSIKTRFNSGSPLYIDVECCHNNNNYLITTSHNGNIALWDIAKIPKHLFKNPLKDYGRTIRFINRKDDTNILLCSYFGSKDLGVILCNIDGTTTKKIPGHTATVYDTDYCNNTTNQLVTISHDNHLRIFNDQLELTHDINIIHEMNGHFYDKVSISPQGNEIVLSMLDKDIYQHIYGSGYLHLILDENFLVINNKQINWQINNKCLEATVNINELKIETYHSQYYYAGFNKKGEIFGIKEDQDSIQTIHFFDSKKVIKTNHVERINEIHFSSDLKYCITCSKDRSVNIINLKRSNNVKQYVMHREGVNDCAITKYNDGYLCLTASYDQHAILFYYDPSSPNGMGQSNFKEIWNFDLGGDINAVTFSEDGDLMAFAVSNKIESSFLVLPTPIGIIEWLRKNHQTKSSQVEPNKKIKEKQLPIDIP